MGSTLASKTSGLSGSIILIFIFFHIGDFTLRVIFPEYKGEQFYTQLEGVTVYNAYAMIIASFSKVWVSLFYIIAMVFLCMHLSHGVSSMFQTVGLRNSKWKNHLDSFALLG
jgi:succinate dehydrogenase / fumarate reductase cytochrome b subunit